MKSVIAFIGATICSLLLINSVNAQQAQSFTDVPPDHMVYDAVEYLRSQGIISGYEDGTFQPDKSVNRAEAMKIIIAPLIKAEVLAQVTETPFEDIETGVWFLPYVEAARQNSIIDGPPKKTNFNGTSTVITAEFLKMLQLANGIEPTKFLGELKIPLATDVSSLDDWFYPYMRYALASSMIMINPDGLLHPEYQLKRGDTALLLYRFMMYQQKKRAQALLSETENEMIITLSMLDQGNIDQAEFASSRALIAARGALVIRPEESVVKGAVKVAEAFRELSKAYRLGSQGKFEEVVTVSGNAWNLAAKAHELSPDLLAITEQVKNIAKVMADSARNELSQPQE
ncbi:S-layer homology domain-containing protein [Patescibacteria group bacterium]|nr:S-layer homology domain-containing protein [Patescibacteria group bacterium]MBU1124034.1 S-layer homology domain-containing protein [Patescibacteria group bacterium]MBU1911245.1 S-layer homology domain-containing protein [Patescibacteria group bacterium]